MKRDILTISDSLLEPPSEISAIRTIDMICHDDLDMHILIHTTQEMKDFIYFWAKPRGLMDYIDYILSEWEYEDGIRVDTLGIYPNTVVEKSLTLNNQLIVVNKITNIL